MTEQEMEILIKHLHQKIEKLEKTCTTFMKTSQAMLSTCRNLELRLTVLEEQEEEE